MYIYIIYIHIIWFIYTNIYIYICINHSEGAVSPRPSSPRWIWMERPTWRLEICKVSVLFFMVDMKKRCAIKRSGCICLQRMAGTKFCKLAVGALWHAGGQGLKMMSSDCACERRRCDHLPHFELMEHAPGWTWCSSWEAYDRAQQLDGWPFPAELELLERLELRWGQCQGKGPGKCLRLEFHILEIHGSAPVWRKNGDVFSQLIWRRTDSICNLLALFFGSSHLTCWFFACLCQQNLLLLGLDVFAPRRTPDPLMTHSFASVGDTGGDETETETFAGCIRTPCISMSGCCPRGFGSKRVWVAYVIYIILWYLMRILCHLCILMWLMWV